MALAGDDSSQSDSKALVSEIVSLTSQGRLIDAIKLYRERTGAGLAEAKQAVEKMQQVFEEQPGISQDQPETASDAELVDLLRQREKVQAIRLYRQRTGCDLREAKEAVERLAAEHGIEAQGVGCLGVLFIASGPLVMWLICP
jgi:ribosomal protein L7/L12